MAVLGKGVRGLLVGLVHVAFRNRYVPQSDHDIHYRNAAGAPLLACVAGGAHPEVLAADCLFFQSELSHPHELPRSVGGQLPGRAARSACTALEAHFDIATAVGGDLIHKFCIRGCHYYYLGD
ncbi:hypothetical protein SDC9_128896 [bioreactor metagenome]|uniref:Uncharacterized protein n=1 Tax=bioreactor metagenome TaxID=1076179 RepID=A0A645CY52_9ZZZZ